MAMLTINKMELVQNKEIRRRHKKRHCQTLP